MRVLPAARANARGRVFRTDRSNPDRMNPQHPHPQTHWMWEQTRRVRPETRNPRPAVSRFLAERCLRMRLDAVIAAMRRLETHHPCASTLQLRIRAHSRVLSPLPVVPALLGPKMNGNATLPLSISVCNTTDARRVQRAKQKAKATSSTVKICSRNTSAVCTRLSRSNDPVPREIPRSRPTGNYMSRECNKAAWSTEGIHLKSLPARTRNADSRLRATDHGMSGQNTSDAIWKRAKGLSSRSINT
jgi:hypothetical protein